jgi:hypothetical protein
MYATPSSMLTAGEDLFEQLMGKHGERRVEVETASVLAQMHCCCCREAASYGVCAPSDQIVGSQYSMLMHVDDPGHASHVL